MKVGQPEPVVTWWRCSEFLQQTLSRTAGGHPRATLLLLRLTRADYRARLTCRVNNSNTTQPMATTTALDMHYEPVVWLRLGGSVRPSSIQEGIDIYFECSVLSNTVESTVSGTFDGRDLHTDGVRGIIVSNHSLALGSVNRSSGGFYACHAANSED
ncbi:hypothetical protein HPB50_003549 [Hyalomma asiaticum]|uniref:Uncharacterized protein n=1 Tax=Hyalomma asiaticum TaxID=266040 RepID=A0ACB7SV46_HYAAI|nr:hypothetical protein HPB50_003549 [Hyalomma asiaticum]